MSLSDLLTPDNYRNYILPAMGVLEAIGTRGRSPGTTAMGQMNAYDKSEDERYTKDRQAKLDTQSAAEAALRQRLGGLQIDNEEASGMQRKEQQARVTALQGKLGKTPEEQSYYDAFPEKYGDTLKPKPVTPKIVPGKDGQFHAIGADGMDVTTGDPVDVAPKAAAPGADKKTWNKENDAINKEYKTAVSSSKSGINLGSADLAYKGIQKTLGSQTITPADVLLVRDQLIKMVNPGYQITSVQFGHSNVGGVVDKLNNILGSASGKKMLTDNQKKQYLDIVNRLGSDLAEEHAGIKNYYSSRAHDTSTRNGWQGSDTLKVEPMNYSFDNPASAPGSVTEADINTMSTEQLKAFLNGK